MNKNQMKIISVVGARPNFMKIAPFIRAIKEYNSLPHPLSPQPPTPPLLEERGPGGEVEHLLVHTGQHYDVRMSETFFRELGIPEPDINLEVGSGTHAEQVGQTMIAFEKVLQREKPDWVVVVGDVNATLACSVTAKKELVKVCHIEAGLRSGDMSMPEEINRLVTDRLADLLLTPDALSDENLRKEGTPEEKIRFVGNIMIDTLEANRERAAALAIEVIIANNAIENSKFQAPNSKQIQNQKSKITQNSKLKTQNSFAVITLHRPSNVDREEVLVPLFRFLADEVAGALPLIWPVHPRTQKMLKQFGLWDEALANPNIIMLHPIGYLEMLRLNMEAKLLLTDSGGLQEECTVLGTPCLTMRWNTERPVTLREYGGASVLVGNNVERIRKEFLETLAMPRTPVRPPLWDGHTAERCLREIIKT
jgi:UDP-N-acetylglucosamine 2-epimerase (non-hydrolysing)